MAVTDWVEWKLAGGLLVHAACGQRTVSVHESFHTSWGVSVLRCSTCRTEISRFEVPEFTWGETHAQPVDPEIQRLEEMM